MRSLRDIFWSLPKHADKWDPYFDVYETWFSKFRGQAPRILEIGVQHGGSSLMWQEYFGPGTKIVGVDIDPRCAAHQTQDIEIVIGDQGDPIFWQQFLAHHTETFDIIIDDGSHYQNDMNLTFSMLNGNVKENGVYLVEDCHTSYWPDHYLPPRPLDNGAGLYNPGSFMEFAKISTDVLNKNHILAKPEAPQLDASVAHMFRRVKASHFYDSIVVFEIGEPKPFGRCLNHGVMMP